LFWTTGSRDAIASAKLPEELLFQANIVGEKKTGQMGLS
jgi:hypothetical protein